MAKYVHYNANPMNNRTGDCVIRAVATVMDKDWYSTAIEIFLQSLIMCDMSDSDNVWGAYLRAKGYKRKAIPDECPDCYTIKDFCNDNPKGRYVLCVPKHVVAVMHGQYFDTWDSGNETPTYYWYKEDEE